MLMKISNLQVTYGVIKAIDGVNVEVQPGEILSVVGANGAGKTTLLKTIAGLLRPAQGQIEYQGENISRQRPDRIVRLGIGLVPEGRRVFPDLTVRENLELGAYAVSGRALRKELFELSLTTFPRLQELFSVVWH